jgi:hypothetical protein
VTAPLSERERDRRVRRLLERQDDDTSPSAVAAFDACPFRTLLWLRHGLSYDTLEAIDVVFALPDDGPPVDLPAEVVPQIKKDLLAGRVLLLMAGTRAARDHAHRQILLALSAPRGSA